MKNKEKIHQILSNDCKVAAYYLHPVNGCTCALGALAQACGVSNETLRQAEMARIDCDAPGGLFKTSQQEFDAVVKIRTAIDNEFGLTVGQQKMLQKANDNWQGTSEEIIESRRSDVLSVLLNLS